MMPVKIFTKIEMIVLYFIIKKNLEISFQNGPEYDTTSLSMNFSNYKNRQKLIKF